MLSLEACRELLGADAPEDDQKLAEYRDEAYRLARLLLEIHRDTLRKSPQGDPKTSKDDII